jgi:hypothetical protein
MRKAADVLQDYQPSFQRIVLLTESDISPRGIGFTSWLIENRAAIQWTKEGLTHVLEHFLIACELSEIGFMKLLPLCLLAILMDEQDALGYGHLDTLQSLLGDRGLFETISGSVNWAKVYNQSELEQLRLLASETVASRTELKLILRNIG